MLTPEEIRNIAFTKGIGGYKTNEVDLFIDQCADTVETLLSEKAELNKKLEILADKLVEYRNDEDSIRTALLKMCIRDRLYIDEYPEKTALLRAALTALEPLYEQKGEMCIRDRLWVVI